MKSCMKCIVVVIGLSVGVGAASGQSLNEDLKLTASDGSEDNRFGWSIAIDNGIVAVGSPFYGFNSGSVYLLDASTGMELFRLRANGGTAGDLLGVSVSIDNGIVAVGSTGDDVHGRESGSAYLFDATTGMQIFKLRASDGKTNDLFGRSIAIDNGIVAVGARTDNDLGFNSGSVYLFNASTGIRFRKLTSGRIGTEFGRSVGIDNGIVAVGAKGDSDQGAGAGAAYLFDASTGMELFKLTASDGAAGDQFGRSIAIDNGIVAVGATGDDDYGSGSGSAYLFDASTGMQLAKFTASDAAEHDQFGYSIAIDNGIVAVGAPSDDDFGSQSGSVYLFDASTGMQLAKFTASDGAELDWFGYSIGIGNGVVTAGASQDDDLGSRSGSAYVVDVACPADLNNDFALNFFDVSDFLELFAAGDLAVDFTGDGVLNYFDISSFVIDFLQGCPLIN